MKKFIPGYLRVTLVFFFTFGMTEYLIDSGSQPAFVRYPMTLLFLGLVLLVLISIEAVIAAINNVSRRLMSEDELRELEYQESLPVTKQQWYRNLIAKLTKTEPMENEEQLLLHHDYDGIRELDNNLPPWWTYLFVATIVFSAIYIVRFEVMGGDNQETEFRKEMAAAAKAVEEYKRTAPDLMDETTVTLLADKGDLDTGKTIYETNCAACHRADAGGQIGPNLTDDHWILGGGIKSLFTTITNGGRDGKGMVAWRGTLKPKEIQKVASYIISLQGTNPKDPKIAEGDIIWSGDENAGAAGSTASAVK